MADENEKSILESVVESIDSSNCNKDICICDVLKNYFEQSDNNSPSSSCQKCEDANKENLVDKMLAMNNDDFDDFLGTLSNEELKQLGEMLLTKNINQFDQFMQKSADSIQRKINSIDNNILSEVSKIEPFNGFCGSRNPYSYGSVEHFVQEWVGTSQSWPEAFLKAREGKLDKNVPKQYHDNMTAAEHYVFGQAMVKDPDAHIFFPLWGWGAPAYQPVKGVSRKLNIGPFKNSSAPSWNQAKWNFLAWFHPLGEEVNSLLLGRDASIISKLGECVINSQEDK